MLHGKTEVMQVTSLLRWTKPLCEGCWLHISADCGSDQGHSAGQRGSWRQGVCPGLWRLLCRVADCKSSLASALGTHNCDPQWVAWAHLEWWFEYPRSCLGQGLLRVWPSLKATGFSSRALPPFLPPRSAEAAFWFSDSDRGFDLWLKELEKSIPDTSGREENDRTCTLRKKMKIYS